MAEMLNGLDESLSRHKNVSGDDIVLRKKCIGKSDCIEYTIEKDLTSSWHSGKLSILTCCVALLALSAHLCSTMGTCFFAALSIILLYDLFWEIEKGEC